MRKMKALGREDKNSSFERVKTTLRKNIGTKKPLFNHALSYRHKEVSSFSTIVTTHITDSSTHPLLMFFCYLVKVECYFTWTLPAPSPNNLSCNYVANRSNRNEAFLKDWLVLIVSLGHTVSMLTKISY